MKTIRLFWAFEKYEEEEKEKERDVFEISEFWLKVVILEVKNATFDFY